MDLHTVLIVVECAVSEIFLLYSKVRNALHGQCSPPKSARQVSASGRERRVENCRKSDLLQVRRFIQVLD